MTQPPSQPQPSPVKLWFSAATFLAGVAGAVAALSQVSQFVREGQLLDLVVGIAAVVVGAGLVALLVRQVARRSPGGSTSGGGTAPGVVLGMAITFSVLLVLGSFAAAGVILRQAPDPPPGPMPAAWADDFSGPDLDPERWKSSTSRQQISVAGGHLEFRVTPALTPRDFQTARVVTKLPAAPVSRIAFTATVMQGTPSQGAVYLVVKQGSGRESRIGMGPSPSGPGAEPWVCPELPCGSSYDGFDHPQSAGFADSRPEHVEVVAAGGRLELHAADVVNLVPIDPSPIVDVEFVLESGHTESWQVTVDDMAMTT
ncbi:MAG: hypothetical protein M3Z25_07765 [Actinomycetota bacterium]|nr:hypothetical protein [Actinomycetota bacterium]